jgi:hypothetical protein
MMRNTESLGRMLRIGLTSRELHHRLEPAR